MSLGHTGCSGGCSGKTEYPEWASNELIEKTKEHPCYTADGHKNARMHIPVAPKCNIQCNYCNRLYDCVNESRPGVTSGVLSPEGAAKKYMLVKEKIDNLKVVGIAGPGDALANFEETKKSVELIQEKDPDVIIGISTHTDRGCNGSGGVENRRKLPRIGGVQWIVHVIGEIHAVIIAARIHPGHSDLVHLASL